MITPDTTAGDGLALAIPPLILRHVAARDAASSALALLGCQQTCAATCSTDVPGLQLFTLSDLAAKSDDTPAGVALTIVTQPGTMELLCLGVDASMPSRTVVHRLVVGVADWLRAAGLHRFVVLPSPCNAAMMADLRAAGFREAFDESDDASLQLSL